MSANFKVIHCTDNTIDLMYVDGNKGVKTNMSTENYDCTTNDELETIKDTLRKIFNVLDNGQWLEIKF